MRGKLGLWLGLGLGLLVGREAGAFSAYEAYLMSGQPTQVGLLAAAPAGREADLAAAIEALATPAAVKALRKKGITGLCAFRKTLAGEPWFLLCFTYAGGDYLAAASDFEGAGEAAARCAALVKPQPRAARFGTRWLQTEWINYIRGSVEKGPARAVMAMVTRIKPEKEAEYRLLHQAVWPGVVDQMARGKARNFSVFLAELGGQLHEFFFMESLSEDAAKDAEMDRTDAVNLRWWKLTDACQEPLPEVEGKGLWAPLERVGAPAPNR